MKYYYIPGVGLCHHGIKGQKWGIRRFQNADGSYTAAGKKRLGIVKKEMSQEAKDAQETNRLKNPHAYNTTKHVKRAVGSAAASLGIALTGSAAVKTLSDKGYNKTASVIHRYSKTTVKSLKMRSQFEMGAAFVNSMFVSPDSYRRYFSEERRIRNM